MANNYFANQIDWPNYIMDKLYIIIFGFHCKLENSITLFSKYKC